MFSHRKLLLLAAALMVVTVLHATGEADTYVRDALAAEARFDARTALALFLKADAARPNDPVILQKISRQYSDATTDTADMAEKKQLCITALAYARRAVDLNPRSAVNLLSLAICYGKLGLYSDTRTRIEYSRHVQEYAVQALALDPDYDYAHHVLGRWNYEVASLGFGTRVIVRLIYGGLPAASTAEAVRHLQRATELSPHRPAHRVELGFALLADGQREAARQTFEQALAMPPVEKYDAESFRRARESLAELK
jgi:tetratricopeptide (TPR) repeat protein